MTTSNKGAATALALYIIVVILTVAIMAAASPLLAGGIRSLTALGALLLAETAAWMYGSRLIRGGFRASIAAYASFGYVIAAYWLAAIFAAFLLFLPVAFYLFMQALFLAVAAIAGGLLYLSNRHISGGEQEDARRTSDWNELLDAALLAKDKLLLWEGNERQTLERELEGLVDVIRYSDPATVSALAAAEYTLQIDLRLLSDMIDSGSGQKPEEQAVAARNIRRKMMELGTEVKQRNRQLAASKG